MKLRRPRRDDAFDWTPPFLLAVFGELDVTIQPALGSVFPGPPVPHRLFVLGAAVLTVWRRRYPLAVQLAVNLVVGLWIVLLFPATEQPPLEAFLMTLVVTYSAAVHARGRRVWAGAALAATWIPGTIVLSLRENQDPGSSIASWILVAAVFGLGLVIRRQRSLVAQLADYARQLEHEREERAILATTLERSRIARELHDVIAHSLSVIVVQAAAERRVMPDAGTGTAEVLRTIEEAGRQAMGEMRRLLGVMRRAEDPPSQVPQPRLRDLDLLIEQVRAAGLAVDLSVEGEPRGLEPGVELSAYRIVQESLSNVLRHAGPARARVRVGYQRGEIELEISDDGHGGAPGASGGHGLIGMRERVALYGGRLEAGPASNGGFRVHAVLPASGPTA